MCIIDILQYCNLQSLSFDLTLQRFSLSFNRMHIKRPKTDRQQLNFKFPSSTIPSTPARYLQKKLIEETPESAIQ